MSYCANNLNNTNTIYTNYEQNSYNHGYPQERMANNDIIYLVYPKHKPVIYDSETGLIIFEKGWNYIIDECGERLFSGPSNSYPIHLPVPANNMDVPDGWHIVEDECGIRMYQGFMKPYKYVDRLTLDEIQSFTPSNTPPYAQSCTYDDIWSSDHQLSDVPPNTPTQLLTKDVISSPPIIMRKIHQINNLQFSPIYYSRYTESDYIDTDTEYNNSLSSPYSEYESDEWSPIDYD